MSRVGAGAGAGFKIRGNNGAGAESKIRGNNGAGAGSKIRGNNGAGAENKYLRLCNTVRNILRHRIKL